MPLTKIPPSTSLADQQFIQVTGPDNIISGFQYNRETRTLYAKESQVISQGAHGITHISEDLVPSATCDTPGLMSADDKCKLDALLRTRIGVLGFQGAGFPDDGGWMGGDIIFAAGSDFISLERIGNVIRFTVDAPVQLSCYCEVCAQIFWVQDETEVAAIRPPTCAGRLPGLDAYGDLKIYLLPENIVVDPTNPTVVLNTKGNYPSLIFKRYDNTATPGLGEIALTLKRNPNNLSDAVVGWFMTPGSGLAECVWFMGDDSVGNRIRFDLKPNNVPTMLGSLLYKGHLLTKQMAVIVDYTPQALSTNQYVCRFWDVAGGAPVGNQFTATNVWQYNNPESSTTGTNARALELDRTRDLLAIGTLVELWFYQVGTTAGTPIRRYFFSKKPESAPSNTWSIMGATQFGDILVARTETAHGGTGTGSDAEEVSGIRDFEPSEWGITCLDNPLILFGDVETAGPEPSVELNDQHRAYIDTALPGLRVEAASGNTEPYSQRPVHLWCRKAMGNMLATMHLGRPQTEGFPPYDVLLTAPVDNYDNVYLRVVGKGTFISAPGYWVLVKGAHHKDLPTFGALRMLTPPRNSIWQFDNKMVYPSLDDDAIALSSTSGFPGEIGSVVELLHQDYNAPCVRVQFKTIVGSTDTVQLQFKVGMLDMTQPYEEDIGSVDIDDYVRGLSPGYAVSAVYTQPGLYTGVGDRPVNEVDGFIVYEGGLVGPSQEYWNELEIMQEDGHVWIWWNGLLVPPSPTLSAALPTPVSIATPYFPITLPLTYGKFGIRAFPGTKLRRMVVRAPGRAFSAYTPGQLELV